MEFEKNDNLTRVYSHPAEVASRLKSLDLSLDILREAIRFGMGYAVECTKNDPSAAKGIIPWAKVNRGLRDLLIPQGWDRNDAQNYARTVHPGKKWAIAVSAGNYNTGNPNQTPATKGQKGPITHHVVAVNQLQLDFWELVPGWEHRSADMCTWILLYHGIDDPHTVRAELSLPEGLNDDGRVTVWRERIILAVFDERTFEGDILPKGDVPSAPIDVPVQLKRTNVDDSNGIQSA